MVLTSSEALIDLIKKSEGFAPKIIDDVGHPMIGYGCDLMPEEVSHYTGKTISEEEATQLLISRLIPAMECVKTYVKVELSQNQFDALSDFVYNVGSGNFRNSTLLQKLNAKDYAGAAEEFEKWNMSGGKVLPGLTARRNKEKELFLS